MSEGVTSSGPALRVQMCDLGAPNNVYQSQINNLPINEAINTVDCYEKELAKIEELKYK